jgi:hypothetical protein
MLDDVSLKLSTNLIGVKLLPLKLLGTQMKSNGTNDIPTRFINVELPAKTIDDLHELKKKMGAKSQTELIVKMVAVMKGIEKAMRSA